MRLDSDAVVMLTRGMHRKADAPETAWLDVLATARHAPRILPKRKIDKRHHISMNCPHVTSTDFAKRFGRYRLTAYEHGALWITWNGDFTHVLSSREAFLVRNQRLRDAQVDLEAAKEQNQIPQDMLDDTKAALREAPSQCVVCQ